MGTRHYFALWALLWSPATIRAQDESPHRSRFVTVEPNVQLEVLEWGTRGDPIVLLAGLGATAHTFDDFAPKLAEFYHVYGITRRGFGRSSRPKTGYDADELGDDVLAVVDSLGLTRPVLAGHSMAGEELSSIGSRHPEKVSGLVYLDAGADYAFYDPSYGHATIDLNEIVRQLDKIRIGSTATPTERRATVRSLADTTLPALLKQLRWELGQPMRTGRGVPPMDHATRAIFLGQRKYSAIKGPVLAIFAEPGEAPPGFEKDPDMRAMVAEVDSATAKQVAAFAHGVPQARVVRIPRANHFIYRTNQALVIQEMRSFIDRLPKREQDR
jgi:pimeloyl-ACP methyl ester carboxylesterase